MKLLNIKRQATSETRTRREKRFCRRSRLGIERLEDRLLLTHGVAVFAEADLDGSQEVPGVVTAMTGEVEVEIEDGVLEFELKVKKNTHDIFAAHIHCAAPGVNGPVGVTLFVGSFTASKGTLAEGTIAGPNVGNGCGWATLADVAADIASGATYVNVHTTAASGGVPSGETRGNLPGDDDDGDDNDALHVLDAAVHGGVGADLTQRLLQPIVADAISSWAGMGVDTSNLSTVDVRIDDLSGSLLGLAYSDHIVMDLNAAGFGWSMGSSPAFGAVDLLSAVTHELGHRLGFHHDGAFDVMRPTLAPGVSRISSLISPVADFSAAVLQRSTYLSFPSPDLDSGIAPLMEHLRYGAANQYHDGSSLAPIETQTNRLNRDEATATLSAQQAMVDLVLGEATVSPLVEDTVVEELALASLFATDNEEAHVADEEQEDNED